MNVRTRGLPWRRLLSAALAAVAIFLFWSQVSERGQREAARGSTISAEAREAGQGWDTGVGFADQRRLDEHFQKHGAEFGRITKQDYLRQAQLLRDAKVGGPIQETVRRDGVVTRFDRDTGGFIAFNPNGVIRTFFKPNDGERYYRRQSERGND
jgi:ribulose bisphosphate carboxylase small subunit